MLYDVQVRTQADDGSMGWGTDTVTNNLHFALRRNAEINRKAFARILDAEGTQRYGLTA